MSLGTKVYIGSNYKKLLHTYLGKLIKEGDGSWSKFMNLSSEERAEFIEAYYQLEKDLTTVVVESEWVEPQNRNRD